MSTPSRTPHRLHIPHIDTSVARRSLDDYSAYSGWETPLSAIDRRRPSLTYSALSEPSPSSVPTTPGYRIGAHDTTPLFFADGNNALRMMGCHKGMPNMLRPVRNPAAMTSFDLMSGDDTHFHMPAALSPVCESFDTSFGSNASTESWSTIAEPQMQPHLGQPIMFRAPALKTESPFAEQDHMAKGMYTDGFVQMPSALSHSSYDSIPSQQYFSPQQLVMPTEDMMYVHHIDSGMTSPIDHHTLHSSSLGSYSSFSPFSPGNTSPPMHEYSLPDDSMMMRPKVEDDTSMRVLTMSHPSFSQHSPSAARRNRLVRKGPAHKRGRAGSLQYVASRYDVDLAIDTKGIEYNTENGCYQKKNVSTETKRWKCSVPGCNSRSARKEHLRRHELSHQPDKQFHCALPKCGRAITRSDNLIQHLMTHARPSKAGKRNTHHSRQKIEQMVLETMTDKKLAERTINNLGKAIDREQDKRHGMDSEHDWNNNNNNINSEADDETADCLRYDS